MVNCVKESELEERQVALLFADDAITLRKNNECQDKDSSYCTHVSEQLLFPVEKESNININDEHSTCSDSSYDSGSSDDTSYQNTQGGIIHAHGTRSKENEAMKSDLMKRNDLPIDVQFSIPSILILILYCIASLSFYSFCNEFLEVVYKTRPNMTLDRYYAILFAIGLFILRLTGNLWYWTGECQGGRFYRVLKRSKRRRKAFVKSMIEQNTGRTKNRIISYIIQLDTGVIKFFHRHNLLRGVLTVFAFNCIYISMYYVQSTKLQKYIAEPRDIYLKDLPSVKYFSKNNQHIKSSMMYRALSLDSLEDQQLESNASCQALSQDLVQFLQLQDELFLEDSNYLYQQLSSNSYYALMGDKSVHLTNQKKMLLYNGVLYLVCAIILVAMLKWPLLEI